MQGRTTIRLKSLSIILILLVCRTLYAYGAESTLPEGDSKVLSEMRRSLFDSVTANKRVDAASSVPEEQIQSDSVPKGQYQISDDDYQKFVRHYRQLIYEWQLFSSKMIFFVVLSLVFVGIYFAAVQFHSGLRRKNQREVKDTDQTTEFDASIEGLKVRSPVLGVVILAISMAFFYLYLQYVYPIKPGV